MAYTGDADVPAIVGAWIPAALAAGSQPRFPHPRGVGSTWLTKTARGDGLRRHPRMDGSQSHGCKPREVCLKSMTLRLQKTARRMNKLRQPSHDGCDERQGFRRISTKALIYSFRLVFAVLAHRTITITLCVREPRQSLCTGACIAASGGARPTRFPSPSTSPFKPGPHDFAFASDQALADGRTCRVPPHILNAASSA